MVTPSEVAEVIIEALVKGGHIPLASTDREPFYIIVRTIIAHDAEQANKLIKSHIEERRRLLIAIADTLANGTGWASHSWIKHQDEKYHREGNLTEIANRFRRYWNIE